MAEPFIGEIKMWALDFAPRDWALCNGQIVAIQQSQALYSLLGTAYGGDGRTTFGIPEMRGRVPIGEGSCNVGGHYERGNAGGLETVTLSQAQLPAHTHDLMATHTVGTKNAIGTTKTRVLAKSASDPGYVPAGNLTTLNPDTTTKTGGGRSHSNMQPSLPINFTIAMVGAYPSRN